MRPRYIFPVLASMDDLSSLAVQFLQLGSGLGEQRGTPPRTAQDGRRFLKSRTLKVLISSRIKHSVFLFSMENEHEANIITMATTGISPTPAA